MQNFFRALMGAPILALATTAAQAQFYAGVKLGSVNNNVPNASETSDAVGILGGYSINPNFAVEVGSTSLGSANAGDIKFNAFEVSALGFVTINPQISLFGKLGWASTEEKSSLLNASVTKSAATWGLGGQYNINQRWSVRLGYDQYKLGGRSSTFIFFDGDSNFYSFTGIYRF